MLRVAWNSRPHFYSPKKKLSSRWYRYQALMFLLIAGAPARAAQREVCQHDEPAGLAACQPRHRAVPAIQPRLRLTQGTPFSTLPLKYNG
jgi:hypothetical protein